MVSSKIRESNLIMIVKKLGEEVTDTAPEKLETLDIFSLAIRSIINDADEGLAQPLISNLSPNLLAGISGKNSKIQAECVDITTELIKKFGSLIAR
mgnify:CR=1 FL=1